MLWAVYFWAVALMSVWVAAKSLHGEPELKRQADDPSVVLVIALALLAPMTYLQEIGLSALGLPSWVAWAEYAMTAAVLAQRLACRQRVLGEARGVMFINLLIALHGLNVLSG